MTPTRSLLTVAAVLLAITGIMHSYLGERVLFGRLLALPDLPLMRGDRRYTERVIRFAWHATSLAWWGLAGVLGALAFDQTSRAVIGGIVGGTALTTGAVILGSCGRRHPAWWLFMLIGGFALAAAAIDPDRWSSP